MGKAQRKIKEERIAAKRHKTCIIIAFCTGIIWIYRITTMKKRGNPGNPVNPGNPGSNLQGNHTGLPLHGDQLSFALFCVKRKKL